MGTEIFGANVFNTSTNFMIVKLNNPLMGTEIIIFNKSNNFCDFIIVKLNNPLMGTEIDSSHFYFSF